MTTFGKKMAENKKQSADEIVDNLAEEMGVKDEKVPDASSEDLATDLGGIFGVSSKKKKKKVEPVAEVAPAPEVVEEEEEEPLHDEEEAPIVEPTPKVEKAKKSPDKPATVKKVAPENPTPKKKSAAIDGVFATGPQAAVHDDHPSSYHLDEDDLGGARPGGPNMGLIGVIVLLVVALLGVVLFVTPIGKDILLVFKGEYRSQKDARIAAEEEEFNRAQREALPRFGNLMITGNPLYATIKLNGEPQYGQTSSGLWREVLLKPGTSNFGNLPVKEKQVIEVSAPGFETANFELTEGKWQGGGDEGGGPSSFNYVATLLPSNEWSKNEFDARMGSDVDNEFFGSVTLNSSPAGASVLFNNKPLLDEKGNELKTPVTFTSAYTKDDKGKLEEVPVRVDTTIDVGHKIELAFPDKPDMPRYGTQLERQMWVCNKKDEAAVKKLPKDHTIQHECDYTYSKTVDFDGLKGYIKRREEDKKRIEEHNKKIKEMRVKAMEQKGQISPEEAAKLQKAAE